MMELVPKPPVMVPPGLTVQAYPVIPVCVLYVNELPIQVAAVPVIEGDGKAFTVTAYEVGLVAWQPNELA